MDNYIFKRDFSLVLICFFERFEIFVYRLIRMYSPWGFCFCVQRPFSPGHVAVCDLHWRQRLFLSFMSLSAEEKQFCLRLSFSTVSGFPHIISG